MHGTAVTDSPVIGDLKIAAIGKHHKQEDPYEQTLRSGADSGVLVGLFVK